MSTATVKRKRTAKRKSPGRASKTARPMALPAPEGPMGLLSRSLEELLRAEASEVVRVLLNMAKGQEGKGDVRAAALIMKLLEKTTEGGEPIDDSQSEQALAELEARLKALPPALAEELVGALAEVGAEAEAEAARANPRKGRATAGAGGLRGLPERDPSDPGESSISSLSLSEEAADF